MATRWQEAVNLARAVQRGEVASYGRAAQQLAAYILKEQEDIDLALAEARCPFPEEPNTSPEIPAAKHHTMPYPIHEDDDYSDETIVENIEVDGPRTGVLASPQTGVRTREVLPARHNRLDGKDDE